MASAGVLHGELGLLSLFDLGQLLMLNRATGELTIESEGRRGYFYFDAGMIVNAVDDEYHEGEGAAYRLFTWRAGHFDFVPGAATGSRTIEENTEGLMMEAARRMDEAGASGEDRQAARLVARASSFEALREAFQSVASASTGPAELGAEGGGSAFALLRDADDALLFRPGQPSRLRSHGRWRAVSPQPLEPTAYDALRSRLLDAGSEPADGSCERVAVIEGGQHVAVTHLGGEHEGLWVRAASLAPAGSARLEGERVMLDALLAGPRGLLLIAGPDPATTERFFHACIARAG